MPFSICQRWFRNSSHHRKLRELLPYSDSRKRNVTKELITFVTDRKGHDLRYAIDPQKIKNELGWEPEIMFSDGIVKAIKWYLNNPEWLENVTTGDYVKYYEQMYSTRWTSAIRRNININLQAAWRSRGKWSLWNAPSVDRERIEGYANISWRKEPRRHTW